MGERLTWDEMVEKYPDKWVAVDKAEKKGSDVLSGVLVAVIPDKDIEDYMADNLRKGYDFVRTTEGAFNGITGSDIVISVE